MNDKDRELLHNILQAGGAAAQKGFEELVRWCFADALANIICYMAVAAICLFLLLQLFRWKPKDDFDSDGKHILRVAGIVICVLVLAISTGNWLPGNLRELISPQGEAIAYVLSHH